MRAPIVRPRMAAFIAFLSLAAALAMLQLDRRVGPAQQRINVRWSEVTTQAGRTTAEATLGLDAGEELEPGKWVYTLRDRSRGAIRRVVAHPLVADTAHIDRGRFQVTIDAPAVPPLLRRFLEAGLALPFSLAAFAIGVVGLWLARRELGGTFLRVAAGPEGAPRHVHPVRPQLAHPIPQRIVAILLAVQDDWDWWASRAYFPLIGGILALMLLFTGWQGRELADTWDGWTIGDWLITYAGGFVRRGLSGELVLAASSALGVPANNMTWAVFVLVFAVFCAAFMVLLRRRRVTFWFLVLCLSPAFVLFTLYNPETVGRKDGLLVAALALWAMVVTRQHLRVATAVGAAAVAFVLTLMHELVFFFTPYFVLVPYLLARQRRPHEPWWLSTLVPAGSGLAVVLVAGLSGSLSEPALCTRLVASGAAPRICEGVLSYGHESIPEALDEFTDAATAPTAVALGTAAAVTVLPPMLFLLISASTATVAYVGIGALVGALLFSAPLFILAVDWGRWLALHATLATVVCCVVLPARGRLPFRPPFTARSLVSLAGGALVLATMFSYSVKYCCRATLVQPLAPVEMANEMWQKLDF